MKTASNLSIDDQVRASRHRAALLSLLKRERDPDVRVELHKQLVLFSDLLQLRAPNLHAIGHAVSGKGALAAEVLVPFWAALDQLWRRGEAFDHATSEGVLGLRLPQLRSLFEKHGIELRIDRALQHALKTSEQPRFLASSQPMHSAITGSTVKCWVFAVVEGQGRALRHDSAADNDNQCME